MTRKVRLNDVSLRESTQVAKGEMDPEAQMTYVKYLIEGGIDQIEVGYPISSPEEFEKCVRLNRLVKRTKNLPIPLTAGLSRALEGDIREVKRAGCDVCHIYIPASDQLMLTQFNADAYGDSSEGKRDWVINQAVSMVRFARNIGFKHVEYSPEDAARTDPDFVCKIVEAVIAAGATIVNIPDTTGLRIGNEFGDLIKYLFERVRNIHEAIISVHCHNDSDHSTHNALQAILYGATQIEGTFYGLGERSGMTKFETVLMNVMTRQDVFQDIEIGFQRSKCLEIVNFVGNALGMPVPRHWPVVGWQNGICSSGTHQAIEAKAKEQGKTSAYYAWNPVLYGHEEVETVITKSSGKAGLYERLTSLGYRVNSRQLTEIYNRANQVSSAKSGASLKNRELVAIVQDIVTEIPNKIEVKRCQAIGGKGSMPMAGVYIKSEGKKANAPSFGNGPIDAIMKAVVEAAKKIYPILGDVNIILEEWRPIPITVGTEAMGDVYVAIQVVDGKGGLFTGRAVDVDTNQASAQAFANCLSCYITYRLKK